MQSLTDCWNFNHTMNKSPSRSSGNSRALNCASWSQNSKCRPPVRSQHNPQNTSPNLGPRALRLALGQGDQRREVGAGIGGNGSAVAVEGETSGQFIRHELVVGRPLQGQEAFQKQIHVGGPVRPVRAAGELGPEGGGLTQPAGAQAIEVST